MDKSILKPIAYIILGIVIGAVIVLNIINPTKASLQAGSETAAPQAKAERKILYWTGSMHPQVRMDGPGKCPLCGMDLIPVYEDGDDNMNKADLKLGERARQLATIRTEKVEERKLMKDIYAVAKLDYDETRVAYISAWNDGRIDNLYADFTGIRVKKGEALALLYSPGLISAQQEYLLTYKSRGVNARSKLNLLGITNSQIKKIEKAGEPLTHLTITSPISGTVISKNIREGQYVKTGNLIYTIADLSKLWAYLDIYEYDLPSVKVGQEVKLHVEAYPDKEFSGVITFIDPFLDERTRTVKVRVDVENKDKILKPGLFVTAHIHDAILDAKSPEYKKILAVKKEAVLDTGLRKVVYVELDKGVFSMREIETGSLAGDYYPVKSGLKKGEDVVVSGNFLIDSQMQLTGKPSIMFPDGSSYDPHAAMGHTTGGDDDMEMDDITMDDM